VEPSNPARWYKGEKAQTNLFICRFRSRTLCGATHQLNLLSAHHSDVHCSMTAVYFTGLAFVLCWQITLAFPSPTTPAKEL